MTLHVDIHYCNNLFFIILCYIMEKPLALLQEQTILVLKIIFNVNLKR